MPAIPKHLQIRRIDDLVAAGVGVFLEIEKPGVNSTSKLTAVCLVPTIAQSLQICCINNLIPAASVFIEIEKSSNNVFH